MIRIKSQKKKPNAWILHVSRFKEIGASSGYTLVSGGFLKYLHVKEQPSSFVARDTCENSVGRPSVLDFWVYFQSVLKSVTVCEAPVDRIRRHLAAVERRLEVPPRRLKDFPVFVTGILLWYLCSAYSKGDLGKNQ